MVLEAVIGLEIHVQLTTKSKMFCACANIFGDVPPNSAICPICLGYPGTLPVPNRTAIEWTQRVGAALHSELAHHSKFDRKSYFYPDLPKGYQISQYDQPFCRGGWLDIAPDGAARRIGIERIHLEEDAAKNIHAADGRHTLVDFNRAGTPLMELVTQPDLRLPQEAKVFLQELQRIMRALKVSDANMEKGQMRCDANISLREVGSQGLHPKTEVKNLNSFRHVERALAYEIERQTKLWRSGKPPPHPSTRGYDAKNGRTTEQRRKEAAADYRYFPEPDIPPLAFSQVELEKFTRAMTELPTDKRERFKRQYDVSDHQAQLLVDAPDLAQFFEETVTELQQLETEETSLARREIKALVQLAVNVIVRQLRELMGREKIGYAGLKVTPANFAELVALLHNGRIAAAAVAPVLAEMQRTGGDPDPIIAKLGVAQVSDEVMLEKTVDHVLEEYPDVVEKIKAGKQSAMQFLVGQVMAKLRGQANPAKVTELLQRKTKI